MYMYMLYYVPICVHLKSTLQRGSFGRRQRVRSASRSRSGPGGFGGVAEDAAASASRGAEEAAEFPPKMFPFGFPKQAQYWRPAGNFVHQHAHDGP